MTTEWELQVQLTRRWAADGAVVLERRHLLVAWEVMAPSWGINDSRGRWNEPSVDFLLIDASGQLRALELKRTLATAQQAHAAGVQVTHRALRLSRTFSVERLRIAHDECWSGRHARLAANEQPTSIEERFGQFFGTSAPDWQQRLTIERLVGAPAVGTDAATALTQMSTLGRQELLELCQDQKRIGSRGLIEGRRLAEAMETAGFTFDEPIGAVTVPND